MTILLFMSVMVLTSQTQNQSTENLIELIKNSNSEDAKAHENTLLNLNLTNKDISEYYLDIGYAFYKKENYNRSYYYVGQAIDYAKLVDDNALLSLAYLRQGNIFLLDWKNQQAIDAYYKSIEYSKKAKDFNREAIALTNIAIILRRMRQYDKALKICKDASKLIVEGENQINLITIISETYLDLEQLDSVQLSANRGIEMSKKLNYHPGLIDLYIKKGIVYCLKNDFENSMNYLNKAEKVIYDNNILSNKFLTNLKYARARCFYEKGEYDKAISGLKEIINLFGDTINPRKGHVLDAHLLLAKSYKKTESIDESILWYDKYILLNEQYQNTQAQTVNKIYIKDNEYLDIEIENLKKDRLRSRKNYTYILTAFSIGIVTLTMFLISYRKKQKSNKILFNSLLEKTTVLEALEHKNTSSAKEIIIDDTKIASIIKGLDKLEEQEYYLNSNCNLRSVAKKVKTNATYLSKIINTHKDKNFNDYINDLRIDYTIKCLKNNKQFRSFSIKSIATEVGYKSDYSFAKHFKARTGLNPSYYIKQIEQLNKPKKQRN